jgi:CRP/FNR family transcriptional regulator
MDSRLATLLIDRAAGENPIRTTHQEIAAELGSSREVISRLLEDLSRAGLIRTGRGRIEVLDGDSLRQRSLM